MEVKISFNGKYFEVKLVGNATIEDCRRYFDQLTSHQNFAPGALILSDETELELEELTTPKVMTMASIFRSRREIFGPARFAAYSDSDLTYGLNRMFQGHTQVHWNGEIRAFRSRTEALKWLLGDPEEQQ
jgi:hypothetical protein